MSEHDDMMQFFKGEPPNDRDMELEALSLKATVLALRAESKPLDALFDGGKWEDSAISELDATKAVDATQGESTDAPSAPTRWKPSLRVSPAGQLVMDARTTLAWECYKQIVGATANEQPSQHSAQVAFRAADNFLVVACAQSRGQMFWHHHSEENKPSVNLELLSAIVTALDKLAAANPLRQ